MCPETSRSPDLVPITTNKNQRKINNTLALPLNTTFKQSTIHKQSVTMATSFILSTPNTGIVPFSSSMTSPRSEDSYEDGPAENGRPDTFPSVEHRMYVINRNGTGEASYLLLTDDAKAILSYRVHGEKWKPIENILNFGVVVLDSWIYVIGGFDKSLAATLKRVIRYDSREGQWEACKDMMQSRSRFGACVVGGKIWVCGGERSDGKVTASCEIYDPDTNEWSRGGNLLSPRSSPSCVSYGPDLLCAGGFYNGTAHNNLWLYEDHRWQELDEHYPHRLPYSLDKTAVARHGNTFYFVGGVTTLPHHDKDRKTHTSSSSTTTNNNNTTSKASSTISSNNKTSSSHRNNRPQKQAPPPPPPPSPPPRPRFVTERRMFSFTTSIQAGERSVTTPQLDLISPWNLKLPPLIHPRHSAGAVTIGSKIHVVGGTSIETGQPIKMSEHFDLVTGQWEEDFSLRRCDLSSVSCVVVGVPKVPFQDRKSVVRLRWVMW